MLFHKLVKTPPQAASLTLTTKNKVIYFLKLLTLKYNK